MQKLLQQVSDLATTASGNALFCQVSLLSFLLVIQLAGFVRSPYSVVCMKCMLQRIVQETMPKYGALLLSNVTTKKVHATKCSLTTGSHVPQVLL